LLFVDGSADPAPDLASGFRAGVGACALDPCLKKYAYFGAEVPQRILKHWTADGAKHVIAQAELLPILLSRRCFPDLLEGRPVICMVDNESARSAMIRGSSGNRFSLEIVDAVIEHDMKDHSMVWYARVPSASNLADAPSRGRAPLELPGWPQAERREPAF